MSKKSYFKTHWKHIVIWLAIVCVIVVALRYGIDKKAVVFGTVVLGVFTQAFAGLAALVGALPLIGPFIVKVFALPLVWIIHATGSFVGAERCTGFKYYIYNCKTHYFQEILILLVQECI